MTWDEFKIFVDSALANMGCPGSVDIQYIDISHPDASHAMSRPEVTVSIEPKSKHSGVAQKPELAIFT